MLFFVFNDPGPTEIKRYVNTLSLTDALPIYGISARDRFVGLRAGAGMEPAEHHGAAGPAGQRRMRRSCPRAGLPRQFLLRTGLRLCRLALPWHAGSLPGRLRAVSLCRLPRRLHVAHAARKRSAGFLPARPRLCVDHRTTMTLRSEKLWVGKEGERTCRTRW